MLVGNNIVVQCDETTIYSRLVVLDTTNISDDIKKIQWKIGITE